MPEDKRCPITPPLEFGKPKPEKCGGEIRLVPGETDVDDFEYCTVCKSRWTLDGKHRE